MILMAGARSENEKLFYPLSELAGATARARKKDTPDPRQAYAPFGSRRKEKPPYWEELPWA